MYCSNCGKKLEGEADYCLNCGKKITTDPKKEIEENTFGWGLLGFLIPLVGLILFLVWKTEKPKASKSAGIGALIGSAGVVLFVVIIIILFPIIFTFDTYTESNYSKCKYATCGSCYSDEKICTYYNEDNEKFEIITCPCDENSY